MVNSDSGFADSGYQSNFEPGRYRPPYVTDPNSPTLGAVQNSGSNVAPQNDGGLGDAAGDHIPTPPKHEPRAASPTPSPPPSAASPQSSPDRDSGYISGSQLSFVPARTVASISPGSPHVSTIGDGNLPTRDSGSRYTPMETCPVDFNTQVPSVSSSPPPPVITNPTPAPINQVGLQPPARDTTGNTQWYPNMVDKQDVDFLKWGSGCSASLSFIDYGYDLTEFDMRGAWTTEKFPDETADYCERAAKFGTRANLIPAEVRELDCMFVQNDVDMRGAWTTEKFPDYCHEDESFDPEFMRRGTKAVLLKPAEVREIDACHPNDGEMEDVPSCWSPTSMVHGTVWSNGKPYPIIQPANSWPYSQPQSLTPSSSNWYLPETLVPGQAANECYCGSSPYCRNECADKMDYQFEKTVHQIPFEAKPTPEPTFLDGGKTTYYDHSIGKWRIGNITGDTPKEVHDQLMALAIMVKTVDPGIERKKKEEIERNKPTKIVMVPNGAGGIYLPGPQKTVVFTDETDGNEQVTFSIPGTKKVWTLPWQSVGGGKGGNNGNGGGGGGGGGNTNGTQPWKGKNGRQGQNGNGHQNGGGGGGRGGGRNNGNNRGRGGKRGRGQGGGN